MKLHILAGSKFGNLTAIKEGERLRLPSGQYNRTILCKCDCGNEKAIRLSHLVRGRITSCGCKMPKHGNTKDKLYNTWRAMKNRCNLDSHINANRYKKRGITLFEDWNKFLVFKDWALKNGYKEGLQIDRIDNSIGYYPDNCRFVTSYENSKNRDCTFKVLYNGNLIPFTDALYMANSYSKYHTIFQRIKRGWNPQKAIDTPIRKGNYRNA